MPKVGRFHLLCGVECGDGIGAGLVMGATADCVRFGLHIDLENMTVPGRTRTILDKAQLILMKTDKQEYRLEILRSFAPYAWKFLKRAGGDLQGP